MGIVNQGVIKTSAIGSVIGESSILAPKSERHKREVHAELLLAIIGWKKPMWIPPITQCGFPRLRAAYSH